MGLQLVYLAIFALTILHLLSYLVSVFLARRVTSLEALVIRRTRVYTDLSDTTTSQASLERSHTVTEVTTPSDTSETSPSTWEE